MRPLAALSLLALALLGAGPCEAGDGSPGRWNTIRLPESLALSPDGKTLVVSWRGDLWRVASAGGAAQRLTSHPAGDTRPQISPDGTQVAFLSTRTGVDQVHVMPLAGGTPEQVTLHTEGARLYGWFPDGTSVLIRTRRDHAWRGSDRYFRKPLALEAPPEMLFDDYGGVAAISPDGRFLAFTREGMSWSRKGYRGAKAAQIWLYDMQAKSFERLSKGDHGELWPLWGAHSRTLYYVSEEDGTWNLWRRELPKGTRTQITHHKDDGVSFPALSRDGSTLVYRRLFDIYRLGLATGGKPARVQAHDSGDSAIELVERRTLKKATDVAFAKDAREIAFIAGGDVWVMDTELREPRQITNTPGEERHPVFGPDFKSIFFVSDAAGTTDVWQVHRSDPTKHWWQNDTFRAERLTENEAIESDLTLTPDGTRLAFLRGRGDLWTMTLDGTDAKQHVTSWSGLQFSFSPDGHWVAYSKSDDDFNSDIWIAPLDGSREPVNVSVHPDNDRNPVWSPDGKTLAFVGRRWDDDTDVCYVNLRKRDAETDARDRKLEKALEKMKGRDKKKGAKAGAAKSAGKKASAKPAAKSSRGPLVGRWVGSLSGPEPLPENGLEVTLVVERAEDGSYTCRLDVVGQFSGEASSFSFDAKSGTVTFATTTPLGPLSATGKVREDRMEGEWEIEGLMSGTFEATREAVAEDGTSEKKPAAAGTKKPGKGPEPVEIDFEDITERVRRITIADSDESGLLWSPDSRKLAFYATVKGARGLYTVEFPEKLTPKLLTTTRGSKPRWLKEGKQIAWLVGGLPATLSASGKNTSYSFSVRQTVDLPALHGAVFEQAWRIMRDHYYDPRLGNKDWEAVRAKYGPMAAQCATRPELELVTNLMLGELNGSHLGFRARSPSWSRPGWRDVTGHLGARFDPTFEGPGLKVRDVIEGTPAHAERHRIEPGEVIVEIDGQAVGPGANLGRIMTGDPARPIEVRVKDAAGKERTLSMRPTTYSTVRRKLYDHWIEATRKAVTEKSAGRLGYLHVRGMNWSSFLRFEAELYKVGHGKDGLIIDVRDNGGGFTTDHLLTCLTQPRHAVTRPRGGGEGYPQDRMRYAPWHRPVVVLCNQNSFSNAEIFAHAIKTLERGPVVGVTTAGGVISTGGTRIMGVGSLRLPFRGWYLLKSGEDMELNGCEPDHLVWPLAGDFGRGIDRQLDKAVEVGLSEVEAWKKRPRAKLKPASGR